ncbi:cell division protein FtsW [Catenibacillus scindens]|uniref:Probable peptidoglycan glycosyltransferase FtsW n=1 Tax=Catenibacillus scindens TaxID=673271 RepID=A0A7W8HB42_9FIRM|nr:putative lipid II flippase FtsW [Catenibacillus scindens]MBB5264447.1 cell division protein FtsW [Catenibacillus scindens]
MKRKKSLWARSGGEKRKQGKPERFFDYSLFFVVLFLVCFGLVMIYSTTAYTSSVENNGDSFYYVVRQGIFAALGLICAVIISRIDYHFFSRFAFFAYIVMLIIQALTPFIGSGAETHGQSRWIVIGPLQFQPSEISKVALILFLAYVCSRTVKSLHSLAGIGKILIMAVPMIGVVVMTNLSTAIILLGITFIILFVASDRYKPFLAIIGVCVAGMVGGLLMFPYRVGRITAWLNVETDDSAYQIRQSLYAIGSGGIFGKGLGQSIQKLDYLPEAHNDMIFGIICEELGLFGAAAVILLFIILLWRCMIIANNAPDLFGALLVVGVMTQIGIQAFINIAVATNFIPNTGITLPFISYGGTSVAILLCEIGLVLSVSRQIRLER